MKILRKITEKDLGRIDHPDIWSSFTDRLGARAVLLDENNRIALMHVSNRGYYKLPGGGVDEGESIKDALHRELREEMGATHIQILSDIGQIDEYREEFNKKSIHQCFLVKLTGNIEASEQTEKEREHGYKTVWAKDIDEAIRLVDSGIPQEYGHDFERLRELTFLEYARDHLSELLSEQSI